MPKPQKIKRYDSIYKRDHQRKKSVWKIVLAVVVLIGLVFIGYSAAGPFMNFINGRRNNDTPDHSADGSAAIESAEDTSSQPETEKTDESQFTGKVMTTEILQDSASIDQFIQQAKDEGYTAIIVLCKDSQGYLYYPSALELANSLGTVHAGAVDMNAIVHKIKEAGMLPIAKIYAFEDDIGASVLADTAFQYNATAQRWLDNTYESGGKGWLNPFKDNARQYIIGITNEIIDVGFETVILDSVQFPAVRSLEKAGLGELNTNASKAAILQQFVQEVTASANEKNASVIIQVDAGGFLSQQTNLYAMDVISFGAQTYAPTFNFSTMGTGEIYETTKSVINAVKEANPSARIIPVISNASEFDEIRRALDELDIVSYIAEW